MTHSLSNNSRGIGIVAVMIIVVMLSLIGGVIATVVATGSVAKTNDLVREQAFGLVQAGLEYALKRLDDGADPDGDTRYLGRGQFTVDYNSETGVIIIHSNVSGLQAASSPSFSIQGPTSGNMADCLTVDVSGAYLQSWSLDRLRGLTLQNTCNGDVTITSMTVSWSPDSGERMTQIRIEGDNVYTISQPALRSGVFADIIDTVIPACSSFSLDWIRFNSNMDNKNFTLVFTMSDGTTKQAFVQFVANNEAACLDVDLTATYVGYSGYVRLLGGTLTNSCQPPTAIRLTGMTVSWTPTSPSRNMNSINFNGSGNEWSGSAASGAAVTLTTALDLAGGDSADQTYLQFSDDMRGRNFTITYSMRDGTTKTVDFTNMASCLSVTTASECLGASGTELRNQLWTNTCQERSIVVHRASTTWNGFRSRRWIRLGVNGSQVWSGSRRSGQTATLDADVTIAGGATATVNYYRFNGSMTGRTFSHAITLSDTSNVAVPGFSPPNCP